MGSNYIISDNGGFVTKDELYHWGIKGMKWGVRRYQNADGSLTAAGRKRYTNPDGSLNKAGRKKFGNSIKPEVEAAKKKTAKDMTDEELDRAINRARKEDEYNRLRPDLKTDDKNANTKKLMSKLLNEMVVPALVNSGRNALQKALDKQANELLKDKVDPNSKEALQKAYDKLKLQADMEKLKRGTSSMDEMAKEYTLRKTLMKDAQIDPDRQADAAREILKRLGWSDR